jgi:catechol 2,3-dioxygenase-like lactoylglutathione lyase family enzyme
MVTSVRYIVADVEAATAFYTEQVGFQVQMAPGPGFAALVREDLRLLLNQPGAGGAGRAGAEGATPSPGGWNRFQLEVGDLDEVVGRLRDAGVRFRGSVVEGRGGRQVLIEDPSGNPVELFEPAPR